MTNDQLYLAIFLGVIILSAGFLTGMVVRSWVCERSGHRKPPGQQKEES